MSTAAERIAAIRAAKTKAADYNGKKISELENTVIGQAAELKKRFDAKVTDVLDPKHNALAEATAEAIEQIEKGKAEEEHTHALDGEELTGTLPIEKGGTGAATPTEARAALAVYSAEETGIRISHQINAHDAAPTPHEGTLAKKEHTHTKSEITDMPNTLRNPHKFILTGRYTAEYDGEEEVTVNIPRNIWYATCEGGIYATKTATTATRDFTPHEGDILVVHFTGASYTSSVSYAIDGQPYIDVIDRTGYEDGAIAAGATVTYVIVRQTADGDLKLLRVSEELATSGNVGVVRAASNVTDTKDYAVPTCKAVKAYVDEKTAAIEQQLDGLEEVLAAI